ncbi:MAG: hypothetical protein ABEJ22_06225 [Haloferacaceae archaeon]
MAIVQRIRRRDGERRAETEPIHIEVRGDEPRRSRSRGRMRALALGALAGVAAFGWWRRRSRAAEAAREAVEQAEE